MGFGAAMSNHTSHERRLAVRDASHKGHLMSHWSEVGKPTASNPVTDGKDVISLIEFKRHLSSVPKMSSCSKCGRYLVSIGMDVRGAAMEFECDAAPMRLGVGKNELKKWEFGKSW